MSPPSYSHFALRSFFPAWTCIDYHHLAALFHSTAPVGVHEQKGAGTEEDV